MNTVYEKYKKLLESRTKPMTKQQIASLASALNGAKKVNLTIEQREDLEWLVTEQSERPITREHSRIGIEYLRRMAFRPVSGLPREGKCQVFGSLELDIIRGFSKFRFLGYKNTNDASWSPYKQLTPIWRVYSRTGEYFDYYCINHGLYSNIVIIRNSSVPDWKYGQLKLVRG